MNLIRHFDSALAEKQIELVDKLKIYLNMLALLRTDIEALIERTVAKLQAERMLRLVDLEERLEAEKR